MVKLGSTLESSRKDGRLANSDNIYDKISGKMQEDINREVSALSPVDEEDLTRSFNDNGRSVTKFADRSYSPQNFSGKGYKILRKNIKPVSLAITEIVVSSVPTSDGYLAFIINGVESHVDVLASTDITTDKVAEKIATKLKDTMPEYDVSKSASTITLTRKFGGIVSTPSSFSAVGTGASCGVEDCSKIELRNILTPAMINQPNTVYEIRYDFDLMGTEINIKDNCVLSFVGGSLKNGSINGNRTVIEAGAVKIFEEDIYIKGSFINQFNLAEWFGLNYKKTLESFYGIDFIGNYIIDKVTSVDLEDKPMYLRFHDSCKVTVSETFVGEYLFIIANNESATSISYVDYDNNVISGSGKIDLNGRCGFIKFKKSDNFTATNNAKKCIFTDLLVYHAGCSIDKSELTYDSECSPTDAIIYCAYNAVITNCNIAATRKYNASVPDCGIYLNGTDQKINRLTIVTKTIGIYNVKSTYINDCHIWGAPKIAFYLTGDNWISKTYGDWALCSFFVRYGNVIDIHDHYIIAPTSDPSNPYYKGNNMVIIELSKYKTSFTGFLLYSTDSATNARIVVSENDTNTELKDTFNFKKAFKAINISNIVPDLSSYKEYSTAYISDSSNSTHYAKIECFPGRGEVMLIFLSDDGRNSRYNVSYYNTFSLHEYYSSANKFNKSVLSECSYKRESNGKLILLVKYSNKYALLRVVYTNYKYPSSCITITEDEYNSLKLDYTEMSIINRYTKLNANFSNENNEIYSEELESFIHLKENKVNTCAIPEYNTVKLYKDSQILSLGFIAINKDNNKIGRWDGNNFLCNDFGTIESNSKGTTDSRPILKSNNGGFMYYDTTLKKYIVWDGTKWTNMDGTALS